MRGLSRRAPLLIDGLGLLLFASYVIVTIVSARRGGNVGPLVSLLCATAAALAIGRLLGHIHRGLVPAIVIVTAAVVAIFAGPLWGGGPLSGPFGYQNATGAACAQVAIAALMFAGAVRPWPLRTLGVATAVIFTAIGGLNSTAAAVSLLALAAALVGLRGERGVRVSIALSATMVGLVLVGTAVLGATYHTGDDGPVVRGLTERRLVLWQESLRIIGANPGGVGPGRFEEVDPTALRDPDARWAHNEFLQQGVELGWAGLALLVLVFVWGFARLWVHPAPDMLVALGAVSLAALGVHACVDYVLHFPAVPLTAAALVGTAQADQRWRSRRDGDEAREESIEGGGHPDGVAGAATAR